MFMLHKAQILLPHATAHAFEEEEHSFKKTVEVFFTSALPPNAYTIPSHVIYQIKICDDHTLILKAPIAQHGNEDSAKADFFSDC